MKKSLLLCTGESGSGKTTYINNLPNGLFYNLRSLTTRTPRNDEINGDKYVFVDETEFNTTKLVTKLWVNEQIWKPGTPKWLYGVPESEVLENVDKNLVYDVIEPRYARQMIDWFKLKKLDLEYNIKIAWFIPPKNDDIVAKRANMPDDITVRRQNTCNIHDFFDAGLRQPDYILRPRCGNMNQDLKRYIGTLYDEMEMMQTKSINTDRGH